MIYGIKNTPLRKLAPLNFFVNITAKASAITFEKITKQIVYFVVNPSAGRKSPPDVNNVLKFANPTNFADFEIPFHSVSE